MRGPGGRAITLPTAVNAAEIEALQGKAVGSVHDVEIEDGVDWTLATSFLSALQQRKVALGRIGVLEPSLSSKLVI